MCGRFMFNGDGPQARRSFGLPAVAGEDSWCLRATNIAPSQQVAAVVAGAAGEPTARRLRFGLPRPHGRPGLLINARLETVSHLPTFRSLWQAQRCVVPATGFYEWAGGPPPRQPYAFCRADGAAFGLAAIWRPTALPGAPDGALVILTEAAASPVLQIHGRMPVMLEPQAAAAFLQGAPPDPDTWRRMPPSDLTCVKAQPHPLAPARRGVRSPAATPKQ